MKCEPDAEVPPAVVTFTVTVPGAWPGAVTRSSVVLTKWTVPGVTVVAPKATVVAPVTKPVPVRVTVVPPVVGPADGVTLVMVGVAS